MAGILVFLLTFFATQSVVQTAWYYTGAKLGIWSDVVSFVVAGVVTFLITRRGRGSFSPYQGETKRGLWRGLSLLFLIPSLLAFFFAIWSALHAATTNSIRTPWPLMMHGTLLAIAMIFLCAIFAAWRTKSATVTAIISGLAILSIALIAPIVYKLGFGFDGFLHRASEQILLQTGTLVPRPAYYIGQYVFVTWLTRLSHLPLNLIDTYLVPVLSFFIPFAVLIASPKKNARWMVAASMLFIPLSIFISTTPQSLAYVLGFIAICLALSSYLSSSGEQRRDPGIHPMDSSFHWNDRKISAILVGLWAVATHPLAGLPLFGAMVLILIHDRSRARRWTVPVLIATILSVPLAFALNSLISHAQVHWNFGFLLHASTYAALFGGLIAIPANHLTLWADWAAMVQFFSPVFLIALAVFAIAKDATKRRLWILLSVTSLGLALAGLFLRAAGDFAFLIDYERGNFADRLFVIAGLILLVPALNGFAGLMDSSASWRIHRNDKRKILNCALVIIGGFWLAGLAYLALPRNDATIVGHGWSVGQADREAVRRIDHDAGGQPYTVLADQTVSAAAVEAFGFKRYAGDVFFYPIPTGGPLYQVYLDMTKQPSRELVAQAASLGQSRLVYVVLNNYWWNAETVAEALRKISDRWTQINNGTVRIYRFEIK